MKDNKTNCIKACVDSERLKKTWCQIIKLIKYKDHQDTSIGFDFEKETTLF